MKSFITLFVVVLLVQLSFSQTMTVHKKDQTTAAFPLAQIDSITFSLVGVVPTQGLVAYYPFNGNANDGSGNGNNGTVVGATSGSDRFGNLNKAEQFTAGTYISVPDNVAFNVSSDITISAWYKMQSGAIASNMTIVDKRTGNATFWGLYIERVSALSSHFRMLFALYNNVSNFDYQYSKDTTIAENTWSHVVVVVKNDTSMIYLNGILDSVSPITIVRPTNTNPLVIASPGGSARGESFVGLIDDIRIYSRALTDQEVYGLYHEGGW